jgi:hypothetical protein
MKVEFIYDPDCPNVAEARAQLLRAFTETGISPRWVEWSRDSVEAPAYARGFGSPTLLVNGHDVAEQTSAHGNACCRLYADPSGALRGAPSVERIVAALQACRSVGRTQRQLMIITKEHPEDQARKTRTKHYGYDIPLPSHHPDKCDGANNDGEPIHHAITGKNHVQAEPDGQIEHYADHGRGDGG